HVCRVGWVQVVVPVVRPCVAPGSEVLAALLLAGALGHLDRRLTFLGLPLLGGEHQRLDGRRLLGVLSFDGPYVLVREALAQRPLLVVLLLELVAGLYHHAGASHGRTHAPATT